MRLHALVLSSMFSATAALDGSETADLMEQIQQLNQRLDDQQALFEARLQTQEERYERLLAINERAMEVSGRGSTAPSGNGRRRLAKSKDFSGLQIRKDNAGIAMGSDSDVVLARTGDSQLTIFADANVTGSLFVDSNEYSVSDRLNMLEETVFVDSPSTLIKASSWFPAGSSDYGTYTKQTPFGDDGDSDVVFDYPFTAALGYNHLKDGVFTATADGIYYMTCEIRVEDNDSGYVEIEFQHNGADIDSFEMWVPEGDESGRRTAVSSALVRMKEGDTLYPMSDLASGGSMKTQTDVFQVAPDRVAFHSYVTGAVSSTSSNTGVSLMTLYTEADKWATPAEFSGSYEDGVFTAPRDGIYYFACKLRTSDKADGSMEIEWQLNDDETDNSFEMWLSTGDAYGRRAMMSGMLQEMKAGDTVHPIADLVIDSSVKATFSGFELPDDLPAFKVYNDAGFYYTTKEVPFGDNIDTTVEFERGSSGAISDGVYTVPEDGYYYFTVKLRTKDGVESAVGLEFLVNGEDAAHNMVMWTHQGDPYSNPRRAAMTTTLLKLTEGDEVSGVSNLALDSDEVISKWTFSGFKLG